MLGQPEGEMELGAEMPGDLEEEESRGVHPGEWLQNIPALSRPRQPIVSFATTRLPHADQQSPCLAFVCSKLLYGCRQVTSYTWLLPPSLLRGVLKTRGRLAFPCAVQGRVPNRPESEPGGD